MDKREIRNWVIFGGASITITIAAVIFALGPGLRWATDTAVDALPIEFESEVAGSFLDSGMVRGASKDPEVVAALARIALLLPDAGDPRRYTVHLVEDTLLNAFALPGGTIVINRGMMMRLQDESELFAVLGHEAGHVRKRHFLKRVARQLGLAAGAALLIGDAGGVTSVIAGAGKDLVQLGHGRAAEEEADDEGLATLRRLRLDPQGMVRLLGHLKAADKGVGKTPEFISTHPSADRRIVRVQDALAALLATPAGPQGRVLTDAEWSALKQHPVSRDSVSR
jgi:predicted Zn-dependent protease